ncbi:MAG: hypothetical protein E6R04_02330 [Spirochaetes bacterium]|nr:MAG: hypothetical protein E6R04_02330 [Spirochaetota bacterium]
MRVNVLINEITKTAKQLTQVSSSAFLQSLDALSTYEERFEACRARGMKVLGEGSARTVFSFGINSVIKLAVSEVGAEQNKAEASGCGNELGSEILARVQRSGRDYYWIVMEKLQPVRSDQEFEQLAGVEMQQLREVLTFWYAETVQRARHRLFKPDEYERTLKLPLAKSLMVVIKQCNLLPGDLAKYSSWGVTKNGSLKLLDFGLTQQIFMKHYYK